VAPHHVADLVAEHARELAEVLRPLDEPAVHVDEASGHREGVHFLRVDDEELEVQLLATRGEARDGVAEHVDVAVDLGIAHDRQLLVDLRRVLRAHLDLLLRRDPARGDR